jgi:hypothetical protein
MEACLDVAENCAAVLRWQPRAHLAGKEVRCFFGGKGGVAPAGRAVSSVLEQRIREIRLKQGSKSSVSERQQRSKMWVEGAMRMLQARVMVMVMAMVGCSDVTCTYMSGCSREQ